MIAVLVCEQNAVEFLRRDAALLETNDNLPRAQPAIDKNFAVIRRNQRAITGTAAAEHREGEHAGTFNRTDRISQMETRVSISFSKKLSRAGAGSHQEKVGDGSARMRAFLAS